MSGNESENQAMPPSSLLESAANNPPRPNEPGYIHGDYFPHIDGIRALAVLPVVAFHLLATLCPGGFAGVDVFFVISGYLITGVVLKDLHNDRFTIRNFYHRRIRRIYPAGFAMMAGVFAACCVIYYCVRLKKMADAMAMSNVFMANIFYFSQNGDYFAQDFRLSPLLHMWSLSVEEQFYLFIPMLLAIVWKFRRKWAAPALGVLCLLSFSASVYAVYSDKTSQAFYLLHYRAWELLVGCILAIQFPPLKNPRMEDPPKNQPASPEISRKWNPNPSVLSVIGLLLILFVYVFYSSKTRFPGPSALPCVLGTAMLIRYGQGGNIGRWLSSAPMVFVGKISYSLYLWHWPAIALWKYVIFNQVRAFDYAGIVLLSFAIAFLSWRFVEIPIRVSRSWTIRKSFTLAGVGTALLLGVSIACVYGNGWPTLFHVQANSLSSRVNVMGSSYVRTQINTFINFSRTIFGYKPLTENAETRIMNIESRWLYALGTRKEPQVLMIGDSHAKSLISGMSLSLKNENLSGIALSHPGAHMFNLNSSRGKTTLKKLEQNPSIKKVVLTQYWTNGNGMNPSKLKAGEVYAQLEEFALEMKARNITLYIIGDVPAFSRSDGDELVRVAMFTPRKMHPGWSGIQTLSQYHHEQGAINDKLKEICLKTDAVFVPLFMSLKQGDHLTAYDEVDGKKIPLYRDGHHLSPDGSFKAAQYLMTYLFPKTEIENTGLE